MAQTSHPKRPAKINLRTPDVMAEVQSRIESHYRSQLVEQIRQQGGTLRRGLTTIQIAKQFGFCYGVERAIDLAYAAAKVFPHHRIFLLGEIIHNPDVNAQIRNLGIRFLKHRPSPEEISSLQPQDIVIVPAFGAEIPTIETIRSIGCQIVDTTCGDVMSVWKRVRQNASERVTSIIHGKASHEETRATASHALGPDGQGHYLIVLNLRQTDLLCDFIRKPSDPQALLTNFQDAHSPGFDPLRHLQKVGVANQTTMLRSETEEIQRRIRQAILDRDGHHANYRQFDTICGATQERQDALFELLKSPPDLLLVIGGYNSSNTTHLVEIGEKTLPTYFIRNASCLLSPIQIRHFDIHSKTETTSSHWLPAPDLPANIGITAGASCPNHLIEETIQRILSLRGESL